MSAQTPQQIFEELASGLPRFEDGRIDFTHATKAPVLNAVVYCHGEILLLKRSEKVIAYPNLWNCISGFIDEPKPVEDFVRQEVEEEISIPIDSIQRIQIAPPHQITDKNINRTWVVFPALTLFLSKPNITLDWEHTDFTWSNPNDVKNHQTVPGLDVSIRKALELLDT